MVQRSKNIKSLKVFGNKYSQELFTPEPPPPVVVKYGKDNLQIGKRLDGSIYTLDLTESCRMLIVGSTRSGKSFTIHSIVDRLNHVGNSVLLLSDIKNEFYINRNPVQDKFQDDLLEGEEPKGMKVVSLRPTFFKTLSKDLPKWNFWYSPDMKSLSKADFLTLMNSTTISIPMQIALEMVYENLRERYKKDETLQFSVDLVYELIDEIEEITSSQKNALKFKFRPLETAKFFEPEWERNIVALIQKGFIPTLNLENFDAYGKGAFNFVDVTMNIVLREVILARRASKIKPLWIVLDEASRFVGNRVSSSLKQSILESVDIDSRFYINWVFCSQTIDDVPERIMKQSKYVLVPGSADVKTIQQILMSTGLTKNIQRSVNDSIKLKNSMKRGKFLWTVINRMEGTKDIIKILPPLSEHLETTR